MNRKLSSSFVSIGDLYVAYRKAKVEAYYENTHYHALEFAAYEKRLHANLCKLHRRLTEPKATWFGDNDFIGDFAYLPKSVDTAEWNNGPDAHFRALDPLIDWEQRFIDSNTRAKAKMRLVIRPSVDFQIVSALWVIKAGHLFDGAINPLVSYGNRLRRSKSEPRDERSTQPGLNLRSTGLFAPYFSAYRAWRENGLSAMEESLKGGKSILAITMDIEQFYHRVSPKFLVRKQFLDSINLTLESQELTFTKQLLSAIDTWYRSTPDFHERPEGGIPVGLSASKIIANVLLSGFDNEIVGTLRPIYFGRYVDDLFLVFENKENLKSASEVIRHIAKTIDNLLIVENGKDTAPSIELSLPYAKDSKILFAGNKQKIFSLSSSHGLDLIQHIRENIRAQSSEYRLLPTVPPSGIQMASKALLAAPDATLEVDALRKADVVSVRRLGISLLLRDLEAYSSDLMPSSWKDVRCEFYSLVNRHLITPAGFFEYFGHIPRIFGLMLANHDAEEATQLVDDLARVCDLIERTTTAGEKIHAEKFNLCKAQYARALLQSGIQASTDRKTDIDSRFLGALKAIKKLDKAVKIPSSASRLQSLSHEILLADWGRRPYKDYWYLSQREDEKGPPVPRSMEVRKKIRLGGIRRFRTESTKLRVPHWPALAFPTRPLRVDEIVLVAPAVLEDPARLKRAIMVLRGARVISDAKIGFKEEDKRLRDNPAEFVVPGRARQKVRVAVTSFLTTDRQWTLAAKNRQDRSLERYVNLNELINKILRERRKPDYIVFPELSMPLRWSLRISRKLASNGISLLAGIEYHTDRTAWRPRNDCLVSLTTNWPGYLSHVVRLQPKFEPSHGERDGLKKLKLRRRSKLYKPAGIDGRVTVYDHRGFVFSILICSDLTNLSHRHSLRGAIDSLFALEWNKDTKTFAALVESSANDLHAYVVQANNRMYGDSRIRAPADEEYLRDVVQVKGGISDYYVMGEIDYIQLRAEQSSKKLKKRRFKPTPIGYKMSERRKNDLK